MLIRCSGCNKDYSKNADCCPRCGPVINQKPVLKKACKTCGAMLVDGDHRWSTTTTIHYMRRGNSHSRDQVNVLHEPCNECGEPMPHSAYIDTSSGSWIIKLALLLGCVLLAEMSRVIFMSVAAEVIGFLIGTAIARTIYSTMKE